MKAELDWADLHKSYLLTMLTEMTNSALKVEAHQ